MSWWSLLRADLTRHPIRMLLTAASLVLAFVLFGLLQPIRVMFADGVDNGDDASLVVGPRHSVADLLPVAHAQRISALPNVETVAHMTWFGGTYREPANFFPQFAVTPDEFLRINREIELPTDQAAAFLTGRRAAIAGADTAARFGWQVGDTIHLIPNIWHNREGGAWAFELVGIFRSSNEALVGNDGFYFGFPYFDEYRAFANGTVGTFIVQVEDPADLAGTARAIDAEFANSSTETKTLSSGQYALSFARQLGEVGLMASLILGAVLFTLLMVTGHTMARSVHERVAQIALLRVLGFRAGAAAALLLTESVLVTVFAGLLGLGIAHVLAVRLETLVPQVRQLGGLIMTPGIAAQGLLLAIAVGLGVALLPVVRAIRRDIVPALRVEA